MPDIFNRQTSNLGGVFAADLATLQFARGVLNALGQQLQFNYTQTITRLYELGSNLIYYVSGRTAGQANLNRVMGPRATVNEIYSQYGNVCNARDNTIELAMDQGTCNFEDGENGANDATRYTLSFAVIQSVTINVAAQDMIISEGLSMTYGSLENINA